MCAEIFTHRPHRPRRPHLLKDNYNSIYVTCLQRLRTRCKNNTTPPLPSPPSPPSHSPTTPACTILSLLRTKCKATPSYYPVILLPANSKTISFRRPSARKTAPKYKTSSHPHPVSRFVPSFKPIATTLRRGIAITTPIRLLPREQLSLPR
jgi:hypothetical protein